MSSILAVASATRENDLSNRSAASLCCSIGGSVSSIASKRPIERVRLRSADPGDSQLAGDRRIRTRQLRRNPPERVTNTIGERPARGERIRSWDHAVGYLDQHQSAHGLTAGLGPIQGPSITRTFLHSRALAASTANKLTPDNGISHDNVMRIGR